MTWNLKTIVLIGVVFLLGVGLWAVTRSEAPVAGPVSYVSKTVNEEGVSVTVKPDISADVWKFQTSLDTHAGSLDQDLGAVSELRDDQGQTFKPFRWIGDPSGGHHRSGVLEFGAIRPLPGSITLVIRSIGQDRTFSWNLK